MMHGANMKIEAEKFSTVEVLHEVRDIHPLCVCNTGYGSLTFWRRNYFFNFSTPCK